MTAIKTILRIIALIIIVAVVGYVLFYVQGRTPAGVSTVTPGPLTGKNETPDATSTASVPVTVETVKESASTSPSISVEYPQFSSLPKEFNASIKTLVTGKLADFRKEAADNYAARKATAPKDEYVRMSDFSFISKWEPAQINAKYVSFVLRFDSYSGGANENQELVTFNYDVAGSRTMDIYDIFTNKTDYLKKLSKISEDQIVAHMKEVVGDGAPTDMVKEGTLPVADNFRNFTFTDNVLTVYFPKYAVAPGAFGEQKVVIPRSSL